MLIFENISEKGSTCACALCTHSHQCLWECDRENDFKKAKVNSHTHTQTLTPSSLIKSNAIQSIY